MPVDGECNGVAFIATRSAWGSERRGDGRARPRVLSYTTQNARISCTGLPSIEIAAVHAQTESSATSGGSCKLVDTFRGAFYKLDQGES